MKITRTANGLRLSQHGVVISELRTTPGPTHSVFDILAALLCRLAPTGRVGLLGFAGGGMMAPLAALGRKAPVDSVDLDRQAYRLFCRHCPDWSAGVRWAHQDAVDWLAAQPQGFQLIVEDLSIPQSGDVVKPAISWSVLPALIRRKLRRGGVGVFNLLPPQGGLAAREVHRIAARFASAVVVDFKDYQNRILVGGSDLPSARALSRSLRLDLKKLRSRQATRIRVRQIKWNPKPALSRST